MMQHIIKKQVIDLSLENGLDAFYIQQQVSNYYYEKIVPLLQKAFDAASGDDEMISIDNLEVNLGTINVKEIEKGNWNEQIFKNISEQLITVKHRLTPGIKMKREPSELSISGQWIFYMQHGYLPWNVLKINDDWYHKTLEAFASDALAIRNLRNCITMYPDAVRRIVFQNSVHFLKSIIETLTAENQDALPGFINKIAKNISSNDKNKKPIQRNEAKLKLWMQALHVAATGEVNLKPEKIDEYLKKNLTNEELNIANLNTSDDKNQINEDGIYVFNAGIVLLHPFLNQFFKTLNLIQEKDFNDTQCQQKALYLLHYLATGSAKPQEYELVIPKVLCAFPLENPVDNLIILAKEELREADSVLSSAIGQWDILKSTSPDGLREGFLQRKGKLFTKNENMVLQVEQNSIDMLLDHLPWNLSIIQLPWMKEILRIDWR